VTGKWIQENKSRDGYGNILYFYENGSFSLHYGSILESRYKLQDDLLIETGIEPAQSNVLARYIYRFEENNLIIQRIISYNPREISGEMVLTAANKSKQIVDPTVVGQWINYTKNGMGVVFEYTADGKKLFFIPDTVKKGTYKISENIVKVTIDGSNIVTYEYVPEGNYLKTLNIKKLSETYHKF